MSRNHSSVFRVYKLMKLSHFVLLSAALMLISPMTLVAQEAAKPAVQSAPGSSSTQVDASLVVVPVSVRDKKGELIKGLSKDAFSLQAGGKDLNISYFQNDSNEPVTVGLLVDVSRNMQSSLDEEKRTSQAFLDALLSQKGDKAFVLHFAHDIELLQDVTDDHARLDKAVRELGTTSSSFSTTTDDGSLDSEGRRIQGHGVAVYDAVYLATE
jgi:VWFA-related protein